MGVWQCGLVSVTVKAGYQLNVPDTQPTVNFFSNSHECIIGERPKILETGYSGLTFLLLSLLALQCVIDSEHPWPISSSFSNPPPSYLCNSVYRPLTPKAELMSELSKSDKHKQSKTSCTEEFG